MQAILGHSPPILLISYPPLVPQRVATIENAMKDYCWNLLSPPPLCYTKKETHFHFHGNNYNERLSINVKSCNIYYLETKCERKQLLSLATPILIFCLFVCYLSEVSCQIEDEISCSFAITSLHL
jgi:hypothetical protein